MNTIRSIRIVERKSPHYEEVSTSVSPNKLFSFSKKDINLKQSELTDIALEEQQNTILNLRNMTKKMLSKCKKLML
jgi:hypothetical protein